MALFLAFATSPSFFQTLFQDAWFTASRATAGVCPCTRSPISRWSEVLLEWPGGAGFGEMWSWAGLEWACPRQVSLVRSSGDAHWHHQQRSREEGRQEERWEEVNTTVTFHCSLNWLGSPVTIQTAPSQLRSNQAWLQKHFPQTIVQWNHSGKSFHIQRLPNRQPRGTNRFT